MIDLRSDTVTVPTKQMRRAMFEAEVGDDVYGEDPTVNRLQQLAAQMLGKEDALLVTSGTMGNQVAVLTHCRPGTEVIVEQDCHIFYYEAAAASAFAGVQMRPLKGIRGALSAEQVEAAIREDDIHLPPTSLICLENTHNRAGGTVISLETMAAVYEVAVRRGVPLHLDGARLFNAAVALGVTARELAACTTTVQFCLSKGLGAPVGSIIVGPQAWIDEARRWRKRMGGGMRQAGIIAAAGIVALETMVDRLADDHANARFLADNLADLPGLEFNPTDVETNLVIFKPTTMSAYEMVDQLQKRGVLAVVMEPDRVRFTTNKDVTPDDVKQALVILREIL